MEFKNGYWSFAPERDVLYRLTVSKEGFSYNRVLFTLANNHDGNKEIRVKPRKGDVAG